MELIEHCLDRHAVQSRVALEVLLEADAWARQEVRNEIGCPEPRNKDAIQESKMTSRG
jgi:hypothetical protein